MAAARDRTSTLFSPGTGHWCSVLSRHSPNESPCGVLPRASPTCEPTYVRDFNPPHRFCASLATRHHSFHLTKPVRTPPYRPVNHFPLERIKKRESSMKSRQLMAAALVAAVMSVASTQTSTAAQRLRSADIVMQYDNGGSIVSYAKRVTRARQQNLSVRFSGACQSACTLFLSLPETQTCITPGASFGFHRAHSASRQTNDWGTSYLLKKYPNWVRHWIDAKGGLKTRVIRMDYAYASRFMQRCA